MATSPLLGRIYDSLELWLACYEAELTELAPIDLDASTRMGLLTPYSDTFLVPDVRCWRSASCSPAPATQMTLTLTE